MADKDPFEGFTSVEEDADPFAGFTGVEEAAPSAGLTGFRSWYADQAKRGGLDPNPDAPEHFYDYRAAYRAGAEPDASGHWPSEFKREGHPRMVVNGIDTRTGQRAGPSAREEAAELGTSSSMLAKKAAEVVMRAPELARAAGRSVVGGAFGLAKGAAGAAEWAGFTDDDARLFFEKKEREWAPPEEYIQDISSNPGLLADPMWWAVNGPGLIPSMAAFILPGLGGARAGLSLARAAKFGVWGSRIAQGAGATAASTAANSMLQGGLAYAAAKEKGADDEVASRVASRVAIKDAGWTAATSGLGLWNPIARSLIASSALEGIQEMIEGYITGSELHREGVGQAPSLSLSEGILGALGGAGMSVAVESAGGVRGETLETAKAEIVQVVAQDLIKQGIPEADAVALAKQGVEQTLSSAQKPDDIPEIYQEPGVEGPQMTAPPPGTFQEGPAAAEVAPGEAQPGAEGAEAGEAVPGAELEAAGLNLEAVDPETGKKASEMSRDEFLAAADREGVDPADASLIHQDITAEAEEKVQESAPPQELPAEQQEPSETQELPEGEQIPRAASSEELSAEGPFQRAYPYVHSIGGKDFTVKGEADDMALHEAIKHGGDPNDVEFLKKRALFYHDEAHKFVPEYISDKKAGKDVSAAEESFKENLYKHLLLLRRNTEGSVPESVKKARETALEKSLSFDVAALELEAEKAAGERGPEAKSPVLMSKEEFKEAFPEADPKVQEEAVKDAALKNFDVPQDVMEEHPKAIEALEDVYVEERRKEVREFYRQRSPTPLLDMIRKAGGVNKDALEKSGFTGEFGGAKSAALRGLVKKSGGTTIGRLSEMAAAEGIISAHDEQEFINKVSEELAAGSKEEFIRAKEREVFSAQLVAEKGAKYEAGKKPPSEGPAMRPAMSAEDFAYLVKKNNVAVGSQVTVKFPFSDPVYGLQAKGRKGRVLGLDMKRARLLVEIGGNTMIVRANNFKELAMPLERPGAGLTTKQVIAKETGLEKAPVVKMTEIAAIREKFKAMQKGSRIGFRQGVRETSAKLSAEMAQENANVAEIKKKLERYVRDILPPDARGKFLVAVRDAKTARNLSRELQRVDWEASKIYKKGLLKDIRVRLAKALESPRVAIDYKERIRGLVEGMETDPRSAELIKRLERAQEYLDSKAETGEAAEVPQIVLEQIDILARTPLGNLSEESLEEIHDRLWILERVGRSEVKLKDTVWELEKQLKLEKIAADARPIESRPEFRTPGKKLPWRFKLANLANAFLDKISKIDKALLTNDALLDLLSKKGEYAGAIYSIFKKTLNGKWNFYKSMSDSWIEPVRELVKGMNEQQMERIGIHAMRAQGEDGMRYLEILGMTKGDIAEVVLTDQEKAVYNAMRAAFENSYASVKRTMKDLYNIEIGRVPFYFPFQTDFKKMSDLEVRDRLSDAYGAAGARKKTLEQSFTKERVGGKQKIKLNAWDIFYRHMDDVAYLVAMQKDVKQLFEIANSKEFRKSVGEIGTDLVLDWVDVVARKGGSRNAARLDALDWLRRNIGASKLAFSPVSALIQPTALFDGAARLGGTWAFDGARNVISEKAWRDFLYQNIPEIRNRIGDDPAYVELSDWKSLEKVQNVGLSALKAGDALTAMAIGSGAYAKKMSELGLEVDFSAPNQEALDYAADIVRRSQGSGRFMDLPLALSAGGFTGNRSLDRAILHFQTFMLYRWSTIRYDMPAEIRNGNPKQAVVAAMYLTMANMAELGIRYGWASVVAGLLGGLGLKLKEREEDFEQKILDQVLGNMPILGNLAYAAAHKTIPLPTLDVPLRGLWSLGEIAKAKKTSGAIAAATKAIGAVADMTGFPILSRAAKIYRAIDDDGSIKFPYRKELRELSEDEKSGHITDDERGRLFRLKLARKRFNRTNSRYKKAIDAGDMERAAALAEDMRKEMEPYAQ